jgi:hypothetical protein
MIDIETGCSKLLCSGLKPAGMALSKNGNYLAFTSCLGEERRNTQQNVFDIWICSVEFKDNLNPICIASNIRMNYGLSFSWGYDNQSIYYTTNGPLSDGGLWLINIFSSDNPKPLYNREDTHLGRDYDAPIPLQNGNVLMVANGKLWRYKSSTRMIEENDIPDGREVFAAFPESIEMYILVQTHEPTEAQDGFWKVNLLTGESKKIIEEPRGHISWFEGGAAYRKNQRDVEEPTTEVGSSIFY